MVPEAKGRTLMRIIYAGCVSKGNRLSSEPFAHKLKTTPPSKRTQDPGRAIRDELTRLGAPRTPVDPAAVQVMKPETRERPFSREGWVFELKHDGFRMLAAAGRGEALLLYKKGRDTTQVFPEVAEAVAGLPFGPLLLDG